MAMEQADESYHKTSQKVDMDGTYFFGRNDEVATLKKCFKRMMTSKRSNSISFDTNFASSHNTFPDSSIPKEVIFIQGSSGVGKSSLAKILQKDVGALENGLFVEGKFDLTTSNEPYSGVAKAFGKICRELQASSKDSVAAVGRMISSELRDEMQALLPLIPELRGIVYAHFSPTRTFGEVNSTAKKRPVQNGQEQWKYSFRRLARALNAAYSPIVLILDDLQWADVSSLHVIDYLLSDLQNPNRLMIIGCYRSEEVLERGALLTSIHTLNEKKSKYSFNMTEMELTSFQVDHVNKMIISILSIEDEKVTEELAEICYRRTLGNPFFVLQFMSMLKNEALLSYNQAQTKWAWNVDEIERKTKFTSDVVTLIQAQMRKMPEDAQLLVQYAACLGTSFSVPTINIIWSEHSSDSDGEASDVHNLLELMEEEGFIEGDDNNGYQWVHDKVQEAALSLSNLVNASFKFKIGKTLVNALDEKQLEEELFDVVDLINRGNIATRPELASLNLRAAQKAKSLSAFQSAAKYIEYGAALLPRDHWKSYRCLTLDLYTLGAEIELALDNSRAAASYCNAVFNGEGCTMMEKLPFRMAIIGKLSGGDAVLKKKALDMCLMLLDDLGYNFIWTKPLLLIQTLLTLAKTVKKTKKRIAEKDFAELLGEMTDPKHLAVTQLLARVIYLSYHLELILIAALANCHIINMTLKHGKCNLSAQALASLGNMARIVLKEDLGLCISYDKIALSMQEDLDSQYEGQTIFIAYCFGLCWKNSLQSCTKPFEEAYRSCMQVGDVEYAAWCMCVSYNWIPYAKGERISKILKDCPRLVSHMEELLQFEQALMVKMHWQLLLNVTTPGNANSRLAGSVFDKKRNPVSKGPLLGLFHFLEGELIFLNSLEAAADRAVRYGEKYWKLCPGAFSGTTEMFHRGVALYAMARQKRKRKYRIRAMNIRKKVKQWIRDGNENVEHFDLLLDAEHASLTQKVCSNEVDVLFQRAIQSAIKSNHLQHKALCNERYAEFLLQVQGDKNGASKKLSEAILAYEEWGASVKVDQLRCRQQKLQ